MVEAYLLPRIFAIVAKPSQPKNRLEMAHRQTTIFRDHARRYASHGFPVFPLVGKIPAIKGGHGVKDATANPTRVSEWIGGYPSANIGVACGGDIRLVVIDVDPRNGGHRTMETLANEGFCFPVCPEVVTGNRGRHLYMRLPSDSAIELFKLGEGIDVQWTGKYVVAPPSITGPSDAGPGGQYRWLRDPWSTPMPELPNWAIARLQRPRAAARSFTPSLSAVAAVRRLDGLARFVAGAPKGNRNNILNWAAFRAGELVRNNQIAAPAVIETLRSAAVASGLDPKSVTQTIESGLRASTNPVESANV
jgi:bifunctional DNA primase/polymerase-like protein